jgi:hypothetical protein
MAKSFEKWYRVKVVFLRREDFIRRSGGFERQKGQPSRPVGRGEGEHALVKDLDGVAKSARKNLAGSEREP